MKRQKIVITVRAIQFIYPHKSLIIINILGLFILQKPETEPLIGQILLIQRILVFQTLNELAGTIILTLFNEGSGKIL